MKRVGFLGAGNMAGAIIRGIHSAKLPVSLTAFDHHPEKVSALQEFGVMQALSVSELLSGLDYLVLAVKPQNLKGALEAMKEILSKDTVLISIAAGVTEQTLSNTLSFPVKVVLVMPNTPLLLSCGACAVARGSLVNDEEFSFARSLFDSAGITEEIPADHMNEVIPINGSSPAFIYEIARHFISYGVSVGLEEKTCLRLFAQTLTGSAKMLTDSGYSVERLIEMVSSKGGTTVEGLKALDENGLGKAVSSACERTVARAYELTR